MPSPEHPCPTPTWPPAWKLSEPGPMGCGGGLTTQLEWIQSLAMDPTADLESQFQTQVL